MSAQGVCITDANGRRILSTHFQNPLRAALAVDAAMASRAAITWVPSLDGDYPRGGTAEASGGEDGRPWASASRGGGHAVVQLERDGLHFIAPVASDVDPILQLTILNKLYEVLVSYIGPVTEASLKDHFDVVLEVLEEMLAAGRPLLSEPSQLRELVVPPAQLLAKVAQNAVNVAGLSASTVPGTNALLSSPLPWRRTGIKYSSNDIYFDVAESLDYLLDSQGKVITGAVTGEISCRSRLSGMPDLTLSFTDPSQLEDCAFNSSVRYARWNKSKIVSFIPPDGAFSLMSFSIGGPSKTASTLSSNPLLTLLPLSIRNTVTTGPLGSTFAFSITSRVPSSRPLTNVVLRFPLGKGANTVTGSASGGAYPRGSGSSSAGAGAGRWEVETEQGRSQVLVWKIAELVSTDRPAVLQGQFFSAIGSKPSPAVTITFDCPSSGFSGLRIAGLQVSGEAYSIYKGVRLTGKGKVEVRCPYSEHRTPSQWTPPTISGTGSWHLVSLRMLSRLRNSFHRLSHTTSNSIRTMASTSRAHSPPTPPQAEGEPLAKRVKHASPTPASDVIAVPELEPVDAPVASTSALPYGKGLHLAPMVRIGTLPTRLLSLEYGAELVWGPEIVDKAIIGSTRVVDEQTGVIRFMKKDRAIFECHPLEKSRLIFQLGSADPELAVQAALLVVNDVAGIGLNCGCPKPFSISGGMGAALLQTPDKLCDILMNLVQRLSVPIDVKIRLLRTQEATLVLVSRLLETGVSALTVHCRTQSMRSSEPALIDRLRDIVEMGKAKGIPVIENGDCMVAADRAKIEELSGVTSIMIARGAERNPSCFRPEGLLDPSDIVSPLYLRVAIATGINYSNTKYCLTAHAATASRRTQMKQAMNKAKTHEEACGVFEIDWVEAQKGVLTELLPGWMARKALIDAEDAAVPGA